MLDGRPSCRSCLHPMECLFDAELWRCAGCGHAESWRRVVQRQADELAVQLAQARAAPAPAPIP